MKRIYLVYAGIFLLGAASCSSGATTQTPGSGGSSPTGKGGTTGTGGDGAGGTTGAGGSGVGGTTGAGGDATGGTAGSAAGASGSAGTGGTAGEAGGGRGGTGGTAGSGTAGSGSGSGGRGGSGTGGTAGSGTGGRGGSATGGTAGSGTGGTTGTGGAAAVCSGDCTAFTNWDNALVKFPCMDMKSGYDCTNIGCSGGKVTTTNSWTIGGTSTTVYNVTIHVQGVVEAQAYGYPGSGMRDAGNASITACAATTCDLFQRGGTVMASGGVSYDYNNYELDVTPAVASSTYNTYFLNSVITSENPHASGTPTSHLTFAIDYTKTIPVMGGGMISLKVFDSNCALVQNCGATADNNMCKSPRTVSLASAVPAVTNFTQPFQGNVTGAYGQWVHFDVTSVTAAQ